MCDDPFSLNNSIRLLSSQLCQSCFAQLWQHEGTIKEVEITGLCSFSHFKDHLNAHGGVKTSQCSIRTGSPNQPYSSLLRCMTVVPPKHPQWPPADTAPPPPPSDRAAAGLSFAALIWQGCWHALPQLHPPPGDQTPFLQLPLCIGEQSGRPWGRPCLQGTAAVRAVLCTSNVQYPILES